MQNGQATAMMSAPVSTASSVRTTLMRLPRFSSTHMCEPPAPQQKRPALARPISIWRGAGGGEDARGLSMLSLWRRDVAGVVVGDGLLAEAVRSRPARSLPSREELREETVWWITSNLPFELRVLVRRSC